MDFVNRLRMNNIFPEGGSNPLQAPANPPFNLDEMSGILDRVIPIARQAKQDEWNHQQHMVDQQMGMQQQQQHMQQAQNEAARVASNVTGTIDPMDLGYGGNGGFVPGGVHAGGGGGRALAPRADPSVLTPYQKGMLENAGERNDINRELGQGRIGVSKENADVGRDRLAQNTGLGYAKLDVAQQNADIANFKAHNPGMKIEAPLGGNYQAIDPITGKATDTGISTGSMTESGSLDKKGSQALEQIGARITGQKDIETQREAGAQTLRGTPEAKQQSSMDVQREQYNRARQVAAEDPDGLGRYIHLDRNGYSFSIDVPQDTGNFITGINKGGNLADVATINDKIYGPSKTGAFNSPAPAPGIAAAPKVINSSKYGKVTVSP